MARRIALLIALLPIALLAFLVTIHSDVRRGIWASLLQGQGGGVFLNSETANRDMESYFESIPTQDGDAFHETVLHTVSPPNAHKPTASAARKDMDDYFNMLPTHHVNVYHDPSLPAHHREVALHFKHFKHGLARSEAYKQLDQYYSSVPAHHVNALHDPNGRAPKLVHPFPDVQAAADMNAFYNEQDRANNQVVVSVGHAEMRRGDDGNTESTSTETVAVHTRNPTTVTATAGVKSTGRGGGVAAAHTSNAAAGVGGEKKEVNEYQTVSSIQEWGPDADEPNQKEKARTSGDYDTSLGDRSKLARQRTLEETPFGLVQTSLARRSKDSVGSEHLGAPYFRKGGTKFERHLETEYKQQYHERLNEHMRKSRAQIEHVHRSRDQALRSRAQVQHDINRSKKSKTTPVGAAKVIHSSVSKQHHIKQVHTAQGTILTGRIGEAVGLGLCSVFGVACG